MDPDVAPPGGDGERTGRARGPTFEDPFTKVDFLAGQHVSLRPASQDDHPFLYQLLVCEGFRYRWWQGDPFPTYEGFVGRLRSAPDPLFLIVDRDSRDPRGVAVAYNLDHVNGTVYAGMIISQSRVNSGIGAEAASIFADYLFAAWNFRKIYLQAVEFTMPLYRRLIGSVLKEEGVLREHRYYNGRFWDEHVLAVYRQDWMRVREQLPSYRPRSSAG